MMAIFPVFIHVKEKTDKELLDEMKREAKWRKLMEEEEARMRRAKLEEKNRKEEERRKKEKEANDAWEELRHKDE